MALNTTIHTSMPNKHVSIKELELNDNVGGFYLTATYVIEDDRSVKRITIHNMRLPITSDFVRIDCEPDTGIVTADIGFGNMVVEGTNSFVETMPGCLERDEKKLFYTEEILEEKAKEMTIEEIEKKLGHKVKIVNEK